MVPVGSPSQRRLRARGINAKRDLALSGMSLIVHTSVGQMIYRSDRSFTDNLDPDLLLSICCAGFA